MSDSAQEQKEFYRDKQLFLIIGLVMAAVATLLLFQFNVLLRSQVAPKPSYFPLTQEGQLFQETPLDKPHVEENVLLNWVVEVAMNSNTFNYVDYPRIIDGVRPYFTEAGYKAYVNSLSKMEILDQLNERKLVLSAVPLKAPRVVLSEIYLGRHMWKVKLPMEFRYRSVGYETYDVIEVTMVIMRVPARDADKGMRIIRYDTELSNEV